MNLPAPPPRYDQHGEAQMRRILQEEDARNHKKGTPLELVSPNGSRFKVTVDDAGVLSAVAL